MSLQVYGPPWDPYRFNTPSEVESVLPSARSSMYPGSMVYEYLAVDNKIIARQYFDDMCSYINASGESNGWYLTASAMGKWFGALFNGNTESLEVMEIFPNGIFSAFSKGALIAFIKAAKDDSDWESAIEMLNYMEDYDLQNFSTFAALATGYIYESYDSVMNASAYEPYLLFRAASRHIEDNSEVFLNQLLNAFNGMPQSIDNYKAFINDYFGKYGSWGGGAALGQFLGKRVSEADVDNTTSIFWRWNPFKVGGKELYKQIVSAAHSTPTWQNDTWVTPGEFLTTLTTDDLVEYCLSLASIYVTHVTYPQS